VALLVATLQTLTSLAQGPCPQNQELLAEHPEFLANLDRVMQSDFHLGWRQRGGKTPRWTTSLKKINCEFDLESMYISKVSP
jgi:hypothetical protein